MNAVHEVIVDQIITKLEAGVIPWKQSWKNGMPMNYCSGKEYRGINILLLSMNDFESNYYLTYKQIKSLGGILAKGSKATKVVYWNIIGADSDSNPNDTKQPIQESDQSGKRRFIAKYYNVFNLSQTNLVPDEMIQEQVELDTNHSKCETILERYKNKPAIELGSYPCYNVKEDTIKIPNRATFNSIDEYYSTLFHELIHSTGSDKRLAREGVVTINHFGSEEYSKEELVAEIGSMFLSSYSNISHTTVENSVAYIGGWLKYIKENKSEILSAASKAEQAVEYILKNGLSY